MEPQAAIDLAREALLVGLKVAAPLLLTGLVAGLVIGLLQAMTQVQEPTVAFVPKLLLMVLALALTLPWLLGQLVEYSRELISEIPGRL